VLPHQEYYLQGTDVNRFQSGGADEHQVGRRALDHQAAAYEHNVCRP